MLWWNRYKTRLREATEENSRLAGEIAAVQSENRHLQTMLRMKTDECEALASRCAHMQSRVEYADNVEVEIKAFEKRLDSFEEIKDRLDKKIERLRAQRDKALMERDEARAMIAARDSIPDTIAPISFDSDAVSLPSEEIPAPQLRPKRKTDAPAPPVSPAQISSSDPSEADSDWYVPPCV